MTMIDLGKLKLNWCGAYDASRAYEIDDVVGYDGSSYIATNNITANHTPPNEGWELMVQGASKQVIQNDVLDPYYWSSTGSKEITPLTTSITPKSTDTKILIMINIFYEANNNSVFRLYRDGVELSIPNNPQSRRAGIMTPPYDQDQASTPAHGSIIFLDSPSSVNEITYHLYHEGASLALNRTISDTNTASYERGTSRMILQEI